MRFSLLQAASAAIVLASSVSGINILLGNDDGFESAQIRETYRLLKKSGHNVVMVAPVDNQSGMGGRSVFTNSPTLSRGSPFGRVQAGDPSIGTDPMDSHIYYYNGTPAACAFVGLDYVLPQKFPNFKPDLIVAGPNFGLNLGIFLYTLSGTMGYTYATIGRGVPAIAFSAANNVQTSYQNITKNTATGLPDPSTIQAQLAVKLVNQLVNNTQAGQPILPTGYGISVNTPFITSATNKSCVNPQFIQTRLTGGGYSDQAVFSNGVFNYANIVSSGVNQYINGNPQLPGEQEIINAGCYSSVSVFSIDYDAPLGRKQSNIRTNQLGDLVAFRSDLTKRDLVERDLDAQMAAVNAPLHP